VTARVRYVLALRLGSLAAQKSQDEGNNMSHVREFTRDGTLGR